MPYQVIKPLVIAKNDEGGDVYVYKGGFVPSGQSESWLDMHLAEGMIELVDDDVDGVATTGADKPKATASTSDWASYATARGLDAEPVATLKRDETRALFDDEPTDESLAAWRKFALAAGFKDDDIAGMDRDAIRALFLQ